VVGGIGWVVSMTMIGYSLIKLFPDIEKHIHIVIVMVILLSTSPSPRPSPSPNPSHQPEPEESRLNRARVGGSG
jgi:hypothetical protein